MNVDRFQFFRSRLQSRETLVFAGISIVCVIAAALMFFFFLRPIDKRDSIKEFNLIVICVDALRADHLGCYGYRRNTSPRIDALAKDGILFKNAYSNSSYTRESVSVILSGLLPSSSGSVGWFASPKSGAKGMGELFKAAGYKTALFSANSLIELEPFKKGFEDVRYYYKEKISGFSPVISGMARDFMKKNRDRKFMMYLHYLDPHGPYEPPKDYFRRFTDMAYENPLTKFGYLRMHCHELLLEGFGPGDPRFENILLRYDAEIAHTDNAIGMVVDSLAELDILDNTIIVITSDHGEEFLEHQYVDHIYTLYRESTHIPLIFWGKPFTRARRFTNNVSSVNILPTVLALLKIPHDRRDFDEHPLFSIENNTLTLIKPLIAELLIQHRNMLRSVVKDNWKYTAAIKWTIAENRPDFFKRDIGAFERNPKLHLDIWSPPIREELFNLSTDPGERFNIITADTAKRDELRNILLLYEKRCKDKHAGKIQRVWDEGQLSPEDKKKLKSLGYL